VPVLNESYKEQNVLFVESLIKALKKDNDDLWLLLHDKDLYEHEKKYHKVDKNDIFPDNNITSNENLYTLITTNRVFTFIHQISDPFFEKVISKLENISVDMIVEELEEHKRVDFAKDIASKMKKKDMVSIINNSTESFDFSKPFL